MGLLSVLEQCAAVEETIGEIYRRLAATEAYEEPVRRIWRQMARDEESHAAQIRLARRLAKDARLQESRLTPAAVGQLSHRAESVLASVSAALPSLDDALEISAKLEQDFLRLHASNSLSLSDPSLLALFASLARGDDEHLRALREYRDARCRDSAAAPPRAA